MSVHDLSDDRARALARTPVSRETAVRLDRLVALLLKWQEIKYLIAFSTVQNPWTHQIADPVPLLDLALAAKIWKEVATADAANCGARPDFIDHCLVASG
jgi:16S rRNA G527 N7-methylase RsmG